MYTHFDKRILSVTHDVTSLLSMGENVMGVQLGNGWYNHQSTAVWFFDKASWRNRPRFTAQLHLRFTTEQQNIWVLIQPGKQLTARLLSTVFIQPNIMMHRKK